MKNFYFLIVIPQFDCIRNIKLRKSVPAYNFMAGIDMKKFQIDLAHAYKSFGHYELLIDKSYNFYEYVSYIQDDDYTEVKCHLHKNDIVTIQVEGYDESYAIIKTIFEHKDNNNNCYPFIYVDWFEDTYQKHNKLDCSLFVLCQNDSWHNIFPLTIVDKIQKAHFVHNCKARCDDNHDPNNNQYIKNEFFFTAI